MKIKKISLLLSCFIAQIYFSQKCAVNLGYDYIGKSASFTGIDFRLNDNYDHNPTNIGAGAYLTTNNRKFVAIPEIHYNRIVYSDFLMGEISASSKNIKPSLGINFLNALHLKLGYSFPFDKNENFKGITFGVHLFWGKNEFYDRLNIIQ